MAFESAHAAIDEMVSKTWANLQSHRASGGDPVDFQAAMVGSFYAEAQRHKPGAGAAHMALAVYQLTVQWELITELREQIAMRDAVLMTLDELEGM